MNWYSKIAAAPKSLGPYRGMKPGDKVQNLRHPDYGVGVVLKTRMEFDESSNKYLYRVDVDFGFSTYGLGTPCSPDELVRMPKTTPVAGKKTLDPNRERLWAEKKPA